MVEMKKYKLYEVSDYVTSKVSTSQLSLQDYVTTDCLLQNKCGRECAENLPPKSAKVTAYKPGDILISNIRPYLKKIWYANSEGGNSADVLTIRAKENFEKLYIYYMLFQDSFFDYVSKGVKGSKMPRGDKNHIMNFEILVPENLQVQKKIASTLSDFDKRIENLRAQNRVLEQTAKTIYDYTFLQCAGHQTTYNKTLNRNIPAGWEVKKLSEIANITMGQSPEGSSYNEIGNGKIFYQGCTDFGVMFPTPRLYTTAPTRFAKVNDILMSVRAPVGTLNIANTECCIGRGLAALNAKEGSNVFLYYVMKNFENHFKNAFSMGTTFGSITKNDLYDLPVLFPDSKTLELFSMQVSPLFKKQLVNSQQIETLTTQRNTLLPLLMTGQIEV
ncbi:MAG: restriction endonuclease subunit S [Fibrobacteraceae bacterium]|nr:restriction endonuclease subunit S [Fibrobacteraceae bacterium]